MHPCTPPIIVTTTFAREIYLFGSSWEMLNQLFGAAYHRVLMVVTMLMFARSPGGLSAARG